MAQFVENKNRKLVPRWRDFKSTVTLGELANPRSLYTPSPKFRQDFLEKVRDWHENKTIPFAIQLVGAGVVHAAPGEVREAAEYLRKDPTIVSPVALALANKIVEDTEATETHVVSGTEGRDSRQQIRFLRARVRFNPYDPICWADLAREFTILGRADKADRAIRAALQMAPTNRFVVRSAVRFYLHREMADRALDLLWRCEATRFDPWLVGPEVGVSSLAGRRSRFGKLAKNMLENRDFSDWHVNELAGSLATAEFEHGNAKAARKLFRRSLVDPSENTVAQVRWACDQKIGLELDESYLEKPLSFEASAWTHYNSADWQMALDQTILWFADQAFSKRPAALGSFLASVALEDHVEAVRMLRQALTANPDDPLLLNNLAYSLANLGYPDEADSHLRKIRSSVDKRIQVLRLATSGLLEYRRGNVESGRALYRSALELARSENNRDLGRRVLMFFALEESKAGGSESNPVIVEALETSQETPDQTMPILSSRIVKNLKARQ